MFSERRTYHQLLPNASDGCNGSSLCLPGCSVTVRSCASRCESQRLQLSFANLVNNRRYASAFSPSLAYIRPVPCLNIWSGLSLGSHARSFTMAAIRFGPAVYLRWSVANLYHVALMICWTTAACAWYCRCLSSAGISEMGMPLIFFSLVRS